MKRLSFAVWILSSILFFCPIIGIAADGDPVLDNVKAGTLYSDKVKVADNAAISPLNLSERSSAPSAPVSGDIYLDTGANTASGNPGLRRYTGAAWEDMDGFSLASNAECVTGTEPAKVVTPAGLTAKLAFDLFPTIASLAANGGYSGERVTATVGENVAIGDVLYFKSDGKFWKANSTVVATSKGMLAMSTGTILADASGILLIKGLIRYDAWAWTVGAELWVHTTAGNPSETQPSTTGNVIRLVGWAVHTNYIWFDPDKTYLEAS